MAGKPLLINVKDCGQGVNLDLPSYELPPGVWSGGYNVRFRDGLSVKRKGMQAQYTTPVVTPYFLSTYITLTARYIVEAGIARVFVDDGTTQTEITRYTDGVEIASITFVGTTATLTTVSAHGRSTGNNVTVFGAAPDLYNFTGPITVTGPTTFTYTMSGTPATNATTVGQYSYNVQSNFTGSIDDKITGGAFNGVLVLNFPNDGMYYWNGDVTTRLRRLPGSPEKADAILFYKNYILALTPTNDGIRQPQLIQWGAAAEPGSVPDTWTPLSTNDAGSTPQTAETGGFLVDGYVFGDTAFVYDQDSRFAVNYIGGQFVFQVSRTPDGNGLLARSCIANTPKGQVFMSNGDIRIHAGGQSQSIVEGVIRDFINADIDSDTAQRAFLVVNAPFNEVWVCYPSYAQETCDSAFAWNWDSGKWSTKFLLSGVTCGTSGLLASALTSGSWASDPESWESDATTWTENEYSPNEQRLILATNTPAIALADTGTTDFGTSVSWQLEKTGISFDDPDIVKILNRSRWQFQGVPGTQVSVYHGAHQTADGAPVYASPATYTQGSTNLLSKFATGGRYMAVKLEGSDDQPLKVRSYNLEFNKTGRF